MEAGVYLEQGVADWFNATSGHRVVKASSDDIIMEHPEYPFIKASPDRIVHLNKSGRMADRAILEIKTTGIDVDPDDIPLMWFIQPLMYAGFWGVDNIIICWYDRHRNTMDFKLHRFDQSLFNDIIQAAVDFWNDHVLTDIPPSAANGSDIAKIYPVEESGKVIIANQEVENLYSKIIELRRNQKTLADTINPLKDKVRVIMKDAEKVLSPQMNTLFTFRAGKKGRTLLIKEI